LPSSRWTTTRFQTLIAARDSTPIRPQIEHALRGKGIDYQS
jgi:hypothetical protein